MKQTWNKPIDKHTDWGGDRSTEGLPVSGQYVQKFIKDTLEEKGGYFHSNSDEGVCYVFSDKEAYDTYVDTGVVLANTVLYFSSSFILVEM